MRRQHLAVRVDLNAKTFGLLQQGVEIGQVVTGDQNGLASLGMNVNLRRLRVAEGIGIGLIQQLHCFQIYLTRAQRHPQQLIERGSRPSQEVQQFMDRREKTGVGQAQLPRVLSISSHSLDAVKNQLLQIPTSCPSD